MRVTPGYEAPRGGPSVRLAVRRGCSYPVEPTLKLWPRGCNPERPQFASVPPLRGCISNLHHVRGQALGKSKFVDPEVIGAPQRRSSPVGGGPTHVIVDEHGTYRAAWSGTWSRRNLGCKVSLVSGKRGSSDRVRERQEVRRL